MQTCIVVKIIFLFISPFGTPSRKEWDSIKSYSWLPWPSTVKQAPKTCCPTLSPTIPPAFVIFRKNPCRTIVPFFLAVLQTLHLVLWPAKRVKQAKLEKQLARGAPSQKRPKCARRKIHTMGFKVSCSRAQRTNWHKCNPNLSCASHKNINVDVICSLFLISLQTLLLQLQIKLRILLPSNDVWLLSGPLATVNMTLQTTTNGSMMIQLWWYGPLLWALQHYQLSSCM